MSGAMHLELTTFNKFVAFIEYFIFTHLEHLSHFFIMRNIYVNYIDKCNDN